jgi:hypothetical protein
MRTKTKTRAQKQERKNNSPPFWGGCRGMDGKENRKSGSTKREPAALEVVDGTTSFAKNIRYQIPFLLNLSSVFADNVLAQRETF